MVTIYEFTEEEKRVVSYKTLTTRRSGPKSIWKLNMCNRSINTVYTNPFSIKNSNIGIGPPDPKSKNNFISHFFKINTITTL